MTAQQLKNSILQMAVQGKLVPQDPNDEPASVLIQKIRDEKEQMIKDGKIKKEKNPSFIFRGDDGLFYEKVGNEETICIEDEIPFEIPDSWEWVRLKSISVINPRNNLEDETEVAFIPMSLLMDGYQNKHTFEVKKWSSVKNGFTHFAEGDIILAKITPCFQNRKSAIVQDIPNGVGAGTTELHVIRSVNADEISNEYLLWIFKSAYFIDSGVKAFTGTAGQQRVGRTFVEDFLIPLPTIEEQHRIANKIIELIPYTDDFETIEKSLSDKQEKFPEELRKSILQMAVQGKLVPQDPNDEPASVLIERIHGEKEKLIKDGKIKRDKHESVIYRRNGSYYEKVHGDERCIDDEIPFEIPESWEWVRFGNVIKLVSGTDFTPTEYNDLGNGIPYITGASNLTEDKVIVSRWTTTPKNIANKGDVLLVCKGSGYGKTVICNIDSAHIARQIMAIKKNIYLNMEYIRIFLQANITYLKSRGQGVIPGIDRKSVLNMILPLPPVQEQDRIVDKVNQALQIIDTMQS